MVETGHCPNCGRDLSEHEKNIRFGVPDVALADDIDLESDGVWLSHPTPTESVFLQLPGPRNFVRSTLPVCLAGGHTVTFGVWLEISREEFQRTIDLWWAPGYSDLTIEGYLANEIAPWSVLGAPVTAGVVNAEHTPVCLDSPHATLRAILRDEWPHETVLSALPA